MALRMAAGGGRSVAAAAALALAAVALLAVVAMGSGRAALLQIVRPYSLARDELIGPEVVYERPTPRRARISFLPMSALELEYPPFSYNNHKLREAACFGFDRNPGPPDNYENWTPDDHATWCQTVTADGDDEGETRIGDPRLRGVPELRVGNLIGEGNALIDTEEYQDADSSMGEAQRQVVDRI